VAMFRMATDLGTPFLGEVPIDTMRVLRVVPTA